MDRVEAARARVRQVRAELSSDSVVFPCTKCRHYELVCTHPAVARVASDPETGRVKLHPEFAKDARSESGACGPEGALFDARSMPGLVAVSVLSSSLGRWTLFLGGAILLAWMTGYG